MKPIYISCSGIKLSGNFSDLLIIHADFFCATERLMNSYKSINI